MFVASREVATSSEEEVCIFVCPIWGAKSFRKLFPEQDMHRFRRSADPYRHFVTWVVRYAEAVAVEKFFVSLGRIVVKHFVTNLCGFGCAKPKVALVHVPEH